MADLEFIQLHRFEKFTKLVDISYTIVKGKKYFCIRGMYKDGDEWKPAKDEGLTFPEEQAAEVRAAVEQAMEVDPFPEEEVLIDLVRNNTEHLRVTMKMYRKKESLDIRKWYQKGDDIFPSKKGITIPPDILDELIVGFDKFEEI